MKIHIRPLYLLLFGLVALGSFASAQTYNQCIITLDPSASASLSMSGAVNVNASSCGVVVDSSSNTAVVTSGTAKLSASSVNIVGGYSSSGTSKITPTPTTHASALANPLSFLTPPTVGSCTYTNTSVSGTNSVTLSPGTYCNGISVSGNARVTLNPGVYVLLGGGLTMSGSSTITGTAVTFFLTASSGHSYGPLAISGTAKLNVSAPTSISSPYYGILFYQDPSIAAHSAASTLSGDATSTIEGVLYFPTTGLTYSGSTSSGNYLILVSDTLNLTGDATINNTFPNSRSPLEPPVSVSVSPGTKVLYPGQTQQFTATVDNSTQGVTWSINPSTAGSISSTGLYTAPSTVSGQQSVTVTATSQEDPSKSATATITLMPSISMIVTPASATLYGSQTVQFSAQVINTSNQAVTWTLNPASGSISAAGLYTAPATITATQNVAVTATSQADPTKSFTATVTLSPPVSVSVTPPTATLYAGETQQFSAQAINTNNTAVTWTLTGPGTLSSAGLYTPPAVISPNQTATVTATSQADTTKSGTATITLLPVSIQLTPSTVNLFVSQTQQFAANVSNATNTAVTWSVNSGGVGTISNTGLYTAPSTLASQQTVTITAVSQSDTSKSSSATITLIPVAITISAPLTTVYAGQTLQLTSNVTDATNTGVTWTLNPATGAGTVTSAGLYSPPASIPAATSVTVTATSQADSTHAASTTISLVPLSVTVNPTSATLSAGQAQQFTASVTNSTVTTVTWAINPSTAGSISSSGLYTAPASISAPQSVTVTATSTVDTTKSATATANLEQSTSITITPQATTLTANQTQQFNATVTGLSNTSVTWSIVPTAGAGTINSTGLYTAPECVPVQQVVTITATSAANNALSVSATVTLQTSNPFAYSRSITVNATQVPNTDQTNFPVLVSVTDPTLASVANGGHVANPSGYDIVFTSDASCLTPLNWEVETWNAATGQLIAWVQMPVLSHSKNTIFYICYGNAGISSPQNRPSATWDSTYVAVWHLSNGIVLSALDSSSNGSNGTINGPTATTGQIDGAGLFNGSSTFISGTGPAIQNTAFTISAWQKPQSYQGDNVYFSIGDNGGGDQAIHLRLTSNTGLHFGMFSDDLDVSVPNMANVWNHTVMTLTQNHTQSIYENGTLAGSRTANNFFIGNSNWNIGKWIAQNNQYYNGSIDEVRISNVARSADWITAEYNNQGSPSTFFTLSAETTPTLPLSNSASILIQPATPVLYASQTLQFTGTVENTCPGMVNWSASPAGAGTISGSGLYAAPSSITTQQSVTITATYAAYTSIAGTATITLEPPVSIVAVTPQTPVLTASQQQQFTATVANVVNSAVTWTLSPTGYGTISTSGLYTAPASISTTQTVTVTATSVVDPTKSLSTVITLANATSFTYHRPIVINHTKVPNTDQSNFAVLFTGTYSFLANVAHGGQVQSTSGFDIIFTGDCNGLDKLNYEIESYNPLNGQITAWVQIPVVSHTADMTFYISYGNANVFSTTALPQAAWDTNYMAVWHLAGTTTLSALDSTVNGNNGNIMGATLATGQIGGAANFSGSGQYIDIGNMGNIPTFGTVSMWVNSATLAGQPNAYSTSAFGNFCDQIRIEVESSGALLAFDGSDFTDCVVNNVEPAFTSSFAPFGWHYLTLTWSMPNTNSGPVATFFDGVPVQTVTNGFYPHTLDDVKIGIGVSTSRGWNGQIDEVRMSNIIRSSDWIATEFNNQSSPSTFYTVFPANTNTISVTPSPTGAYASQTVQFSANVLGNCTAPAVTWSVSGAGTVNSSGLYSAPASITTPQNVTVTATTTGSPVTFGSASLTLLPPASVSVSPATATLFSGGGLQFTASVANALNTAVTWSLNPSGVGTISATGQYTAPPTITSQQNISVVATSAAEPSQSGSATVTLTPGQGNTASGGTFGYVLDLIAQSLCRSPHLAPVITAGPSQSIYLAPTSASTTVTGTVINYTLEPGQALTYAWTLVTGPGAVQFTTANAISAQVAFPAVGTYTLQLAVNDGISTSTALTTVSVFPAPVGNGDSIVITPTVNGPAAVRTPVTVQITFIGSLSGGGQPTMNVQVTGANSQSVSLNPSSYPEYSFTYYGANAGTDTIVATASVCCTTNVTSNTATVNWVNAPSTLSTSPVTAQFFTADGSGTFDTLKTQQPLITQSFPNINFNPSATLTRPFTDIETDQNGNALGTLAAQNSVYEAGVGPMYSFSAVFTGSLNVPAAGSVTFTFASDDGFIFAVGNGAARSSGPQTNTPSQSPFNSYPVMGGVNQRSALAQNTITVNFPAAGAYPYEVDYAKGGDPSLSLTMQSGGIPIPAATLLTLSPATVPSITQGQVETVTLIATNADGVALANQQVNITVTGISPQSRTVTTDATGQNLISYAGSPQLTGADQIQASAIINGATAYSNVVNVNWNNGVNQAPVVSAGQNQSVTLPNEAILTGVVTDDGLPSNTLTITWSVVSGPGPVVFDDPNQAATAAAFTAPGTYVLQLSASDSALTTTSTVTVTASANITWSSGWLASPVNKSTITQPTPIMLVSGITLTSGTLVYYPASNTAAITTLNASTTGAGQIGTFDPTTLADGAYWVDLRGTNSAGVTQDNLALVTVAGDNKPGRVTATITDFTVPAPGLPIQIQRTYDSLNSSLSQDFGFGWRLGIQVNLTENPTGDVTFTLNGKTRTFYFTPQPNQIFTSYFVPQYTPEPGLFGSLITTGDNCSGVLISTGNIYECAINNAGGVYQPTGFQYTDPYGRIYTIGATGAIQSIQDLSGNTLTVTPTGITSTNGLNVPFVRDSSGRITQITDTLGNIYTYAYDTNGNLVSVTYPGIATPDKYGYDSTHLLTSETDMNGNPAGSSTYYTNGQLQSVTDPVGNTTQYAYNAATNTTTVTNPDGGMQSTTYDAYGSPLSVTDPLGRVTTNTYDTTHNLLTTTDPLGKTTTYTYDSSGNRTSTKDPLGDTTSAVYNQVGGPTQVTDPLGNQQNVSYDSNFRISNITDSIGQIGAFTYNSGGLQLTVVDPRGNTSTYTYDQYGNRTSYTDPLNRKTTSTYDTQGNLSSQTDPRGNATYYVYDDLSRKISTTDAAGDVTKYAYDGINNQISQTDALNRVTSNTYDAANRLIKTTYPDSTTKNWTYDFRNNKLTETDQLGRVTKYVYDLAGQLRSTTVAFGTSDAATTSYTYDGDGRKLTQTDPNGNAATWAYDAAGRNTSVTDSVGNVTQYGYDAKGQRTSLIDAKARTTTYTYDVRRRQLTTTTPDSKTVSKTYDGLGYVLTVTDEENRTTTYSYDFASQLSSVTDALSQLTQYTYDPAGNKLTQVDANYHTTSYAWDDLNRRTSRTLPAGQSESYTYDAVSNQKTRTDFNGKTTTFAYDSLNRLLSRTPDASFSTAPISFTYTSTGQRASMTDPSGTTTYTYTDRDQVTSKATPEGTLTYTYDKFGHPLSVVSSNASGTNVSYAWDANERLQSVTDNRTSGVTSYTYDATNQLSTMLYPNGVVHAFTYDIRDRPTNLSVTTGASVLATYNQTFSPTGRKLSAAEGNGRKPNYNYDAIYRLLSEVVTGDPTAVNNGSLTYALDPVGNRQSLTSTLAALSSQSFTYDPDDRLTTDTYDANGNTLVSGGVNYTYDFEDRLISTSTGVQIVYDGDGNRVSETASGVTTKYLVDELTPSVYAQVAEEMVGGAVTVQFTYGSIPISQNRAGALSYYGYDAGWSVRELVNSSAAITDTYDYDAFGNTVAKTGATVNEFLYRAEQFDSALAAYYLRARHYRPRIGRFVTQDTENGLVSRPITQNSYIYAYDDPVDTIDPSGRGFLERAVLFVAAIAASPAVQRAGEAGRGMLSLGASAWLRANYYYDILLENDAIRGKLNVVASGQFLSEAGEVINATAVTANRWIPQLVEAVEEAGDVVVRAQIEYGPSGINDAEQLLYRWAVQMNYRIISIAPAGQPMCVSCMSTLANASAQQLAQYGFGISYF